MRERKQGRKESRERGREEGSKGGTAVVRRTVGWRSFRKRFLMNRKSSLYPGVDGTGVEGRGVSEPLAAGTPRSVPLRGWGGLWNACGWNRKVGPGKGGPPTPVPFTPGYSELLRFIKNRSCEERRPTVPRTSRNLPVGLPDVSMHLEHLKQFH